MTMATISPSRRDVSPAEQLRRSPRLVPPRFRLVAAGSRPESFLMIFFPQRKTPYSQRWASKGHQGAHEAGGRAQGGRACPPPSWMGGGPPWDFRSKNLINSKKMFCGVSGLLELCRIGFQCLVLFQPEFQLPAFPLSVSKPADLG